MSVVICLGPLPTGSIQPKKTSKVTLLVQRPLLNHCRGPSFAGEMPEVLDLVLTVPTLTPVFKMTREG